MSENVIESITIPQARQMMVAAQGLAHAPDRAASRQDVLDAIRRMGQLQIDTIHVVARSPYLVLWSRLGDYPPEWLEESLSEKFLFEYWAHAMCFLPMDDYPIHRRRMLDAIQNRRGPARWAVDYIQKNPEPIERVRAHLSENGAVRSVEFETKNKPPGGWWNWKEEKNALEALFFTGEVMISRRQKFQRVYDLRKRVLPDWNDTDAASSEEMKRELVLKSVRALGVTRLNWVADYFRQLKTGLPALLENLAAEGKIQKLNVKGFEDPFYIHPDNLQYVGEALSGTGAPTLTTLLSPFDPLVWDRQRARELFDFDYTIECYTPAAKRRYGYFTLPILHRGRLVGRLDPKAHRAQGIFEVKTLHLEPGVEPDEDLITSLAAVLRRLAAWHGTPELVVRWSEPAGVAESLVST
jgi:uncharacterized protein YcaQ